MSRIWVEILDFMAACVGCRAGGRDGQIQKYLENNQRMVVSW